MINLGRVGKVVGGVEGDGVGRCAERQAMCEKVMNECRAASTPENIRVYSER